MKFFVVVVLLYSFQWTASAQPTLDWRTLESVKIVYEHDSVHNVWTMYPSFSEALWAWNGQVVRIKGYALPTSVTEGAHILSAFPFSSCFFCGGAGPESVIRLHLQRSDRLRADEWVEFEGTLLLQDRSEAFLYVLENARRVP